jgi:hypothetical protein
MTDSRARARAKATAARFAQDDGISLLCEEGNSRDDSKGDGKCHSQRRRLRRVLRKSFKKRDLEPAVVPVVEGKVEIWRMLLICFGLVKGQVF